MELIGQRAQKPTHVTDYPWRRHPLYIGSRIRHGSAAIIPAQRTSRLHQQNTNIS